MVLMKGVNKTVMEKRYETKSVAYYFCTVCKISPLNIWMSYYLGKKSEVWGTKYCVQQWSVLDFPCDLTASDIEQFLTSLS